MTERTILSADIVPAIADESLSMLLARPLRLDPGRATQDGLAVQTGPLWVEVVEVFHGSAFRPGAKIQMAVSRIEDPAVRDRNAVNQWNNLSFSSGTLLILACTPLSPDACAARAAIEVRSPAAAEIDAVRKAYAIERQRAERARVLPMVAAALLGGEGLLFNYALDLAGRRNGLGREQGGALLIRAIGHASLSRDTRFEVAAHLVMRTRLFDPALKVDPINAGVVSALAGGMVAEADPARRLDWMRLLAATLLGELTPRREETEALRFALVRAAPAPEPRKTLDVLEAIRSAASATDQENATQLRELWRRTLGQS